MKDGAAVHDVYMLLRCITWDQQGVCKESQGMDDRLRGATCDVRVQQSFPFVTGFQVS